MFNKCESTGRCNRVMPEDTIVDDGQVYVFSGNFVSGPDARNFGPDAHNRRQVYVALVERGLGRIVVNGAVDGVKGKPMPGYSAFYERAEFRGIAVKVINKIPEASVDPELDVLKKPKAFADLELDGPIPDALPYEAMRDRTDAALVQVSQAYRIKLPATIPTPIEAQ